MCYTHWSTFSWGFFFKFFTNGYPSFFCSKNFLSSFMQMGFHISFLFKNFYSQVLCKLVPMFSFLKISMKIQVVDPTHEQIKYVQSSIKSTQVWSSIKNSYFWTNPLPTNLINSNKLSLELWLEINCPLEASWKYLNNHVWCGVVLICIFAFCSFYLWWIPCKV